MIGMRRKSSAGTSKGRVVWSVVLTWAAWLLFGAAPLFAQPPEFERRYDLAAAAAKAGNSIEALRHYLAAFEFVKQGGVSRQNTQSLLLDMGVAYLGCGESKNAEAAISKSLEIAAEMWGDADERTIRTMAALLPVYMLQGRSRDAHLLRARRLNALEHLHGSDSLQAATAAGEAGESMRYTNPELAEKFCRRKVEIVETKAANDAGLLCEALFELAAVFSAQGRMKEAEALLDRAAKAAERGLPPGDVRRDRLLMYRQTLYSETGRYPEAESAATEAFQVSHARAKRIPMYLGASGAYLSLAASAQLAVGRAALAARTYEEAEGYLSQGGMPTTFARAGRARAQLALGNFQEAERQYRRAIVADPGRTNAGLIQAELADLLLSRGRAQEAAEEARAGREEAAKAVGAENYLMLAPALAAAEAAVALDDHPEAEKRIAEAERLAEKQPVGPETARARVQLIRARRSLRAGDPVAAVAAADQARRQMFEFAFRTAALLPEHDQAGFLAQLDRPHLYSALRLALEAEASIAARKSAPPPAAAPKRSAPADAGAITDAIADSSVPRGKGEAALPPVPAAPLAGAAASVAGAAAGTKPLETAAEWLLNAKGTAQELAAQKTLWSRETTDPLAAGVLRDWLAVKERLAWRGYVDVARLNQNPNLFDEVRLLQERERVLALELNEFLPKRARTWTTLAEVRNCIPADAVLVEYARVAPSTSGGGWEPRFYAWIIPPAGAGEVEAVDLGRESTLLDAWKPADEALAGPGRRLTEDEAEAERTRTEEALSAVARLILHPLEKKIGGARRWLISPDAVLWRIPWAALPTASGPRVVEERIASLLVSGRDLPRLESAWTSGNAALVVGDPEYLYDPATGQVRPAPPRRAYGPLAETASEARRIADWVRRETKLEPTLLLQTAATEAAVRKSYQPRFASFSTHASYQGRDYVRQDSVLRDPLARCSIALAGAEPGGGDVESGLDGELLGAEILRLDFRGTELVLLCACQTGLGELQAGEGAAGLRQAFQVAGAQSVLSTLWSIPSQETTILMDAFTRELEAGRDKAEALRNAQLATIAALERFRGKTHPRQWAAFTLTGGWKRPKEVRPPSAKPVPKTAVEVTASSVDVLDGSAKAGTLARGAQLQALQRSGDWVLVEGPGLGGKGRGWVKLDQIRRLPATAESKPTKP